MDPNKSIIGASTLDGGKVSEFDSYARKIMAISALLALSCALALYLISYSVDSTLFAGFCLGAAFSMLRWRLIIINLKKFGIGRTGVAPWLRGFFLRYGLTGAVIAISLASDAFSPYTAVAGIFLVNAVIIGEQFFAAFLQRYKGQETWE